MKFRSKEDEVVHLMAELLKAYFQARKGKRKNGEVAKFEVNLAENVLLLAKEIAEKEYVPSPGIAFPVEKPVIREVFAAPFRDRVVHHFLVDLTMDKFDKTFIRNSFSCREGKGTLYGVDSLYKDMQRVSDNWTKEAWVCKFDLQGFFMSLSRDKLWEVTERRLEEFFPAGSYELQLTKYLWREVIMDDPLIGVRKKGRMGLWKKVPGPKSLFRQPMGRGIVIGNLTSQLLSNIFLNELDHFVRDDLGYKNYGRYVDDFYIIVREEEVRKLKKDVRLIEAFVDGLGMKLHPKKRYMQPISRGVDFLGARVYPGRVLAGKRVKGSFYEEMMKERPDKERLSSFVAIMQKYRSWNLLWKMIGGRGEARRGSFWAEGSET